MSPTTFLALKSGVPQAHTVQTNHDAETVAWLRRLPDDVTRCHDESCSLRLTCRRFCGRDTGGVHVSHIATLHPGPGCECTHRIAF